MQLDSCALNSPKLQRAIAYFNEHYPFAFFFLYTLCKWIVLRLILDNWFLAESSTHFVGCVLNNAFSIHPNHTYIYYLKISHFDSLWDAAWNSHCQMRQTVLCVWERERCWVHVCMLPPSDSTQNNESRWVILAARTDCLSSALLQRDPG